MKQDFDGTIVEFPFNPPWDVIEDAAMSTFEIHTAFPNPMKPSVWKKESAGPDHTDFRSFPTDRCLYLTSKTPTKHLWIMWEVGPAWAPGCHGC